MPTTHLNTCIISTVLYIPNLSTVGLGCSFHVKVECVICTPATRNVAQQCVASICLDALATASERPPDDMSDGLLGDLPPNLD